MKIETEIWVKRDNGDEVAGSLSLEFPLVVGDYIDFYVPFFGENTLLIVTKRELDATRLDYIRLKLYTAKAG